MNEDLTRRAREAFAGDRFAAEAAGVEIMEADADYALCRMPVRPVHKNANGVVMGGALFTLADLTFAVAANGGHALTVSADAHIVYPNPATGAMMTARARCVKSGKRTCVFLVEVTQEDGALVALATVTGIRLDKPGILPAQRPD